LSVGPGSGLLANGEWKKWKSCTAWLHVPIYRLNLRLESRRLVLQLLQYPNIHLQPPLLPTQDHNARLCSHRHFTSGFGARLRLVIASCRSATFSCSVTEWRKLWAVVRSGSCLELRNGMAVHRGDLLCLVELVFEISGMQDWVRICVVSML
jgi:hypothetical protein